jgi:phosphate transport system substrate-binding protein
MVHFAFRPIQDAAKNVTSLSHKLLIFVALPPKSFSFNSKGISMKTSFKVSFISLAGVIAMSCVNLASAQEITGAGASFPAPVYSKWAADYNKATGVKINYQSVGSGAGIKQIDSKTVDFGASDMPQTDEVLKSKGQFQFPTVIGGTVPVINVKGIAPGQMKLDGQLLGDIYLGKITRWNDAAIKALNPTLALPDAAIAPVRRADGSGTTFNFTNYLSRVHPEWKAKVGEGTAVNWPLGAGGKGNEGVAAFVSRLPNSIGYVEYSYAKQNKMSYTLMKNRDGVFVTPNEESFKAAAAGANWNQSFYQLITDQPGKNAWPISTATFILMHLKQDKPANATETFKFFSWAFKNGDKIAADLDYVALPDSVVVAIEKAWGQVKDASGKSVALK